MGDKLKVLDLFSGIGGFSLGLERTGGFETVAFCEIDPFCQKVLNKHWPNVPIHNDVRTLNYDGAVDVITGGFPCQDISTSGKKGGIKEGTRSGLWSEIIRLSSHLRPKYILIENVANLLSGPSERHGAWMSRVLCDLASIRYNAEWYCIPASFVGARHERNRVWIIAYPDSERQQVKGGYFNPFNTTPNEDWKTDRIIKYVQGSNMPYVCRDHDGVSGGVDRLKSIGNSVRPQIPEMIGEAILESLNHPLYFPRPSNNPPQ